MKIWLKSKFVMLKILIYLFVTDSMLKIAAYLKKRARKNDTFSSQAPDKRKNVAF
ncbi:hypothetical protein KJ590_02095 [Patescibacteria group bacterium]|nr:hypothetical protein [Patescibacteria group bacterium]